MIKTIHIIQIRWLIALWLSLIITASFATQTPTEQRKDVQAFIDSMVKKHKFSKQELTQLFAQVKLRPRVVKAIKNSAEKKKQWYQYRPIFLTRGNIQAGLAFWEKHADALEKAQQKYGVDPEIIVAIIGVETRYGSNMGSYKVIDAISSLAFNYPDRSKFFTKQLEAYLILTRQENINPLSLKGSYAGAMGIPQFIPTSYQAYAVDFDGDGKRDLWNNPVDAIGSVANYFAKHGWQANKKVASLVRVSGKDYATLVKKSMKPKITVQQMKQQGVHLSEDVPASTKATLMEFGFKHDKQYWLAYKNFYVITRYNHSQLYAMAVYQLSQEIRKKRDKAQDTSAKT